MPSPVKWEAETNISLISHDLVLTLHITTVASPIGYQLSLEDPDFVDTWLQCFAAGARTKKLKDKEKGGENEITDLFGFSWMRGDNKSPPNLEDLTFEKNKSDNKKYDTQEKVGCGWKNEILVDETKNWRTNHKISTPATKCE